MALKKQALTNQTSETIADSAECYAQQSVRSVFSHLLPVCTVLVSSRPKNHLQLLFVKTVLNFTVVSYVEFRSFEIHYYIELANMIPFFSLSTFVT